MISLSGVTKRYQRQMALGGVDLELGTEGIVGLVGRNGAGKTTLLHVLSGFVRPSGGRVRVFDTSPQRAYRRIGFMPELPNYHRSHSAYALLKLLSSTRGLPLKGRSARCRDVLEQVGLGAEGGKQLARYSKGMLQRFGLAQAILSDPDLLILDEPMSGLDPMGQKDFRDIIGGFARAGRIVIVSSHLLFHVERMWPPSDLPREGGSSATRGRSPRRPRATTPSRCAFAAHSPARR